MKVSSPLNIFIVDDDVMMAEMLRDQITHNTTHSVSLFHTGEECIKHVIEKPDVIILDYYLNSKNLDASNGMEVLKAIKKSSSGDSCYFSFVTGTLWCSYANSAKGCRVLYYQG
ncbi:MAG: response regulator receiver protein [Bacteroidetes bacterium OLB10]|nr:MAG: response regulator receiver protein [Bacteroidetes bacterium OLB10]